MKNGFLIEYSPERLASQHIAKQDNSIQSIISAEFLLLYKFSSKFPDDKLVFNNEKYLIVIDGVILNRTALQRKKQCVNWADTIISLYNEHGNCFFTELRGSFCGIFFKKNSHNFVVFSDHIGSKPIYFHTQNNKLVVTTSLPQMYAFLKQKNIAYSLDIKAACSMIKYGFMMEDWTLCSSIKKIIPWHFLSWNNSTKSPEVRRFFNFPKVDSSISTPEDAIEIIDHGFRSSVEMEFAKDQEYNYKHVASLSGGLDSRMTTWVAHDLGYTDQLNITFSQKDYLDETIAKEIACDLDHEWMFKTLDDANFLFDLDTITKLSGGQITYFGLAHQNHMLKYLNFDRLGILHTGQLGDIVISSQIKNQNDLLPEWSQTKGPETVFPLGKYMDIGEAYNLQYENMEDYLYINRYFNCANQGLLPIFQYTETMSPFYNHDFLSTTLQIPLKLRRYHSIYKKWILNKYPKAAQYKWESINKKITDRKEIFIKYKGNSYTLNDFYHRACIKILKEKYNKMNNKCHMNPAGYWLEKKPKLNAYIKNQYEMSRKIMPTELIKEIPDYDKANATNKLMVVSLVSAIRLFFT